MNCTSLPKSAAKEAHHPNCLRRTDITDYQRAVPCHSTTACHRLTTLFPLSPIIDFTGVSPINDTEDRYTRRDRGRLTPRIRKSVTRRTATSPDIQKDEASAPACAPSSSRPRALSPLNSQSARCPRFLESPRPSRASGAEGVAPAHHRKTNPKPRSAHHRRDTPRLSFQGHQRGIPGHR